MPNAITLRDIFNRIADLPPGSDGDAQICQKQLEKFVADTGIKSGLLGKFKFNGTVDFLNDTLDVNKDKKISWTEFYNRGAEILISQMPKCPGKSFLAQLTDMMQAADCDPKDDVVNQKECESSSQKMIAESGATLPAMRAEIGAKLVWALLGKKPDETISLGELATLAAEVDGNPNRS